eukprot:15717-Pleurochrysis_carterae.AAC.1
MNTVATDVDNTPAPSSDDWQADLFGVIPPPASAHAAWSDDCCDEINMRTDPTVLQPIAPAQPSLGIAIMPGLRAVITATRYRSSFSSCFFFKPQTRCQLRLHLPLRQPTRRFCLALSAALELHSLTAALHARQAAIAVSFPPTASRSATLTCA